MKPISPFADVHWFIIRPVKGGLVTQKDQKALGGLFAWRHAKHYVTHFPTACRAEKLREIQQAKLSKPMLVTEVTDAQWSDRCKLPETIAGTGVHATTLQLARSFVIGEVKRRNEHEQN